MSDSTLKQHIYSAFGIYFNKARRLIMPRLITYTMLGTAVLGSYTWKIRMDEMRRKKKLELRPYLKKIAQGVVLTLLLFCGIFVYTRGGMLGESLLYETLPYYTPNNDMAMLFKFNISDETVRLAQETEETDIFESAPEQENSEWPEVIETMTNFERGLEVVGLGDVIYQEETDNSDIETHFYDEMLTIEDLDKLRDLNYLKNKFYIVDKRTDITPEQFDVDKFLSKDLTISTEGNLPKVLIFHTHSSETYADSQDISEGIMAVGARLARVLDDKYGIKALHHTGQYDVVDGSVFRDGAYERMEPSIQKILADNPSIEMVIDLHRDGVDDHIRLVKEVNGKPTAQIMFFNGLTKLYGSNGLQSISYLTNPYIDTNLALSFNLQLAANQLYPGLTRKVYLHAYRFSLHMMPKSILVELGAQTNTKQEAMNAVEPLADILAAVVLR